MRRHLCALALTVAASSTWAATCTRGNVDFGAVSETTSPSPYTYEAMCTAIGLDPNDPATWSFSHQISFTMKQAGNFYGYIDLNYTIAGQSNPQSPGSPFFVISIDPVWMVHDGVTTLIGGEGAGHNEQAKFLAHGVEAGDYTLIFTGHLFDVGARTGMYDGDLNINYFDVAAPVPEPATQALLLLGAPLVAWGARRGVTRHRRG